MKFYHLKKLAAFSFFIVLMSSCSSKNDLVGVYKNVRVSKSEKEKYGTDTYIIRSRLVLNKDSTFMYKTCGVFIYGKWDVTNDSLRLKENYSMFLSEKLKHKKTQLHPAFYKYKILNEVLVTKFNGIDDPKKIWLNKLEKEL